MFFLIHVFLWSKFFPSLINNINLRVPTCNVRNYKQFFASHKNCPSATYAAAANLLCRDIDVFCKGIKSLRAVKKLVIWLISVFCMYCVLCNSVVFILC
jgi:hypothetical protein